MAVKHWDVCILTALFLGILGQWHLVMALGIGMCIVRLGGRDSFLLVLLTYTCLPCWHGIFYACPAGWACLPSNLSLSLFYTVLVTSTCNSSLLPFFLPLPFYLLLCGFVRT